MENIFSYSVYIEGSAIYEILQSDWSEHGL